MIAFLKIKSFLFISLKIVFSVFFTHVSYTWHYCYDKCVFASSVPFSLCLCIIRKHVRYCGR